MYSRSFAVLITIVLAGCQPAPEMRATGNAAKAAKSQAQCAKADHPGGDWPSLNQGLDNSRHQRAESTIGTKQAAALAPAWTFNVADYGATDGIRTTPIVYQGCVYVAVGMGYLGPRGDVFALNADTGELVWHVQTEGSILGLAGDNGLIYATPSDGTRGDVDTPVVTEDYAPAGSFAIALDAQTGEMRWKSERLDDGDAHNGTFVNASPVVYKAGGRKLLFVPLAGGSGDGARVPMWFLDAMTGETVRKAYSLTDAEYEAGYGGTGIWSTAAYDDGYLYAGTSDSDGRTKQHPYNNAILKIDADPRRGSFGSVIGAYSGMSEHADLEQILPLIADNPVCQTFGDGGSVVDPPTFFDSSASPACAELDFDFGGSPNLFRSAAGDLMVGAMQKSGLFHTVNTASMKAAWTMSFGPGSAFSDGSTAAVDDNHIYVSVTPNALFSLAQDTPTLDWASTTAADVFDYQPVTLAGGVLYTISDLGLLLAYDAASGAPLLARAISQDAGVDQCLGVGAGVAVARNTVYVPCDAGGPHDLIGLDQFNPAALVAYR